MAWVAAAIAGSAALNYIGSQNASSAQRDAANNSNNAQLQMYNQSRADAEPWRVAGRNALSQLTGQDPNAQKRIDLQGALDAKNKDSNSLRDLINSSSKNIDINAPAQYGVENPFQTDPITGQQIKSGPIVRQLASNPNPSWQNGIDQNTKDIQGIQGELDRLGTYTPLTQDQIGQQIMSQDPGYNFRLSEGAKAIGAAAAARGNGNSGATLKALTRYGQDYATNEYGNAYNRLSSLAGLGQQTNNTNAQLGSNYANQVSNNYANSANAYGAGQVAGANAIGGGLSSLAGYNLANNMFSNSGYGGSNNGGTNQFGIKLKGY